MQDYRNKGDDGPHNVKHKEQLIVIQAKCVHTYDTKYNVGGKRHQSEQDVESKKILAKMEPPICRIYDVAVSKGVYGGMNKRYPAYPAVQQVHLLIRRIEILEKCAVSRCKYNQERQLSHRENASLVSNVDHRFRCNIQVWELDTRNVEGHHHNVDKNVAEQQKRLQPRRKREV